LTAISTRAFVFQCDFDVAGHGVGPCRGKFLDPYLIASGRKSLESKGGVRFLQQNAAQEDLNECRKYRIHSPNPLKMVKKRVRDVEATPEVPVQASTQDDDSGSDEVICLRTLLSLLLMNIRMLTW
jgi:hypothetical protein